MNLLLARVRGDLWGAWYVKTGETPLLAASQFGHLECLRLLVDLGADVTHTKKVRLSHALPLARVLVVPFHTCAFGNPGRSRRSVSCNLERPPGVFEVPHRPPCASRHNFESMLHVWRTRMCCLQCF